MDKEFMQTEFAKSVFAAAGTTPTTRELEHIRYFSQRGLGNEASLIWFGVGHGLVLRVRNGQFAMVPSRDMSLPAGECPCPNSAAKELIDSGVLCQLSENRNGSRMGWRELGLDGTNAELWVCLQ